MPSKRDTDVPTLGQFEQLVLTAVVVLGDDAWGGAIYDKINQLSTGKPAHLGSMYVALDRLEEKGYVTGSDRHAGGRGRPRRYFRLEAAGDRALRESVATGRRVYDALGGEWRGRWRPRATG